MTVTSSGHIVVDVAPVVVRVIIFVIVMPANVIAASSRLFSAHVSIGSRKATPSDGVLGEFFQPFLFMLDTRLLRASNCSPAVTREN